MSDNKTSKQRLAMKYENCQLGWLSSTTMETATVILWAALHLTMIQAETGE
jgi:hypothetical protein